METVAKVVRSDDHQVSHLAQGGDAGRPSRPAGDEQRPDSFDVTLALGRSAGPAAEGGPRGFDSVEGIGLAVLAAGLAVRAVHLDHLDALAAQEAGERLGHSATAVTTDIYQHAIPDLDAVFAERIASLVAADTAATH